LLLECLSLCTKYGAACQSGIFIPTLQSCQLHSVTGTSHRSVGKRDGTTYFAKEEFITTPNNETAANANKSNLMASPELTTVPITTHSDFSTKAPYNVSTKDLPTTTSPTTADTTTTNSTTTDTTTTSPTTADTTTTSPTTTDTTTTSPTTADTTTTSPTTTDTTTTSPTTADTTTTSPTTVDTTTTSPTTTDTPTTSSTTTDTKISIPAPRSAPPTTTALSVIVYKPSTTVSITTADNSPVIYVADLGSNVDAVDANDTPATETLPYDAADLFDKIVADGLVADGIEAANPTSDSAISDSGQNRIYAGSSNYESLRK